MKYSEVCAVLCVRDVDENRHFIKRKLVAYAQMLFCDISISIFERKLVAHGRMLFCYTSMEIIS